MESFPFLSLSDDLKFEIISKCIDARSYFSFHDSTCEFSLLNKEIYNLLRAKKQWLINRLFGGPVTFTYRKWEEKEIYGFYMCWKKYIISHDEYQVYKIYDYYDPAKKLILVASEIHVLDDYLIDIREEETLIYENLEPIISHTIAGNFSIAKFFLQIDGDIFLNTHYKQELFFSKKSRIKRQLDFSITVKKNQRYYQGIEIPIFGKWDLFFRKDDVSVLTLTSSFRYCVIVMFLAIKGNRILWVDHIEDSFYYISNGFLITPKKILDIYSVTQLNAMLITCNKKREHIAYY